MLPIPQLPFYAERRHIEEAMALIVGMVTTIDDQVGRMIQVLKALGRFENTVIVFTSDHGDYLCAFNLLLKGPWPHHTITRVPFIWSGPDQRRAEISDALASTIDIPATVLARVGLDPYWGVQGKSLLPALGSTAAPRDRVVIEFNAAGPRLDFSQPIRARTLSTKHWRFTMYANEDWGELYDLRADPGETCNLRDAPEVEGVKGRLALELAEELTLLTEDSPRANRLS